MSDTTVNTRGKEKVKIPAPPYNVLRNAFVISTRLVKPIDTYFYLDSLKGLVRIMKNDDDERVIFKSEEENTSGIVDTFECEGYYLIVTQHTIYLLSKEHTIVEN